MVLSVAPKAFADKESLAIIVGEWPPFITQDQRHNGFIAHLISDVFAEEGYEVNYVFRPWNRAYHEAAMGHRDATAVWMHEPGREKDFYYSDPVLQEQFVFFHRKDRDFQWETMEDLKGMIIGGGFSYSYGPDFDQAVADGELNLERVRATSQNVLRLQAKLIDVFPEEYNVGTYTIQKTLAADDAALITHHPRPLLQNNSYVLFPRELSASEDRRAAFNRRLEAFRQSGRYDSYFDAFRDGHYGK